MDNLKPYTMGRWRELEAYQEKMRSARNRCAHVAACELALGFEESHDTYRAILSEIDETYAWLARIMP